MYVYRADPVADDGGGIGVNRGGGDVSVPGAAAGEGYESVEARSLACAHDLCRRDFDCRFHLHRPPLPRDPLVTPPQAAMESVRRSSRGRTAYRSVSAEVGEHDTSIVTNRVRGPKEALWPRWAAECGHVRPFLAGASTCELPPLRIRSWPRPYCRSGHKRVRPPRARRAAVLSPVRA